MKLQVDKRYVNRAGEITDPIELNCDPDGTQIGPYPFKCSRFYYLENGCLAIYKTSVHDLVAEYQESKRGLTLKEAIESGQDYKRPHWSAYYEPDSEGFTREEVLAEDYSLQEEEEVITISKKELAQAYGGALYYGTLWDVLKEKGTVTTRKVKD